MPDMEEFLEYMCDEGVSIYETRKKLGVTPTVILFIREYKKWARCRASEEVEPAKQHITPAAQNKAE